MPKAKTSKFIYDITLGDLPHYTGVITFNKDGDGECTDLAKDFPNYDRNDPRTHVMVTYATLRAALGHDYTGEQTLPPHVAYPPKIIRAFRSHPSRASNAATAGKYHRLYPHNCDTKGKVRKDFGMPAIEPLWRCLEEAAQACYHQGPSQEPREVARERSGREEEGRRDGYGGRGRAAVWQDGTESIRCGD
jgi:hypothetical protein